MKSFTGVYLPPELLNRTDITASEKCILAIIINFSDDENNCYESIKTLAEYSKVSVRKLYMALDKFEKKHLIEFVDASGKKHIKYLLDVTFSDQRGRKYSNERKLNNQQSKYVSMYLNPAFDRDDVQVIGNIESEISSQISAFSGEYEKLSEYARRMKYEDYLRTPYWQYVTIAARIRAKNKCQVCGKSAKLNTHHNTYEHIGYEILHPEDLVVLCENCHSKFHSHGGNE